jgi:hypothetical protein
MKSVAPRPAQRCPEWRLRCFLGWNHTRLDWIGAKRDELWVICKDCGVRRLYLASLKELVEHKEENR